MSEINLTTGVNTEDYALEFTLGSTIQFQDASLDLTADGRLTLMTSVHLGGANFYSQHKLTSFNIPGKVIYTGNQLRDYDGLRSSIVRCYHNAPKCFIAVYSGDLDGSSDFLYSYTYSGLFSYSNNWI